MIHYYRFRHRRVAFFMDKTGCMLGIFLAFCGKLEAADLKPNLKVLICAGDYGRWAQERVPALEKAVASAVPGSPISWEAEQSFNFTKRLESTGWANRFDVIVMGDISLGQITPRAQKNLVDFVRQGGGLVYAMQAKSLLPFKGAQEANPMPLAAILPMQYPDLRAARSDAKTLTSDSSFFEKLDFSKLTDEIARRELGNLLMERVEGKGSVAAIFGAFGPSWKKVRYATYEKVPGGWDDFAGLGEIWARLLERVGAGSLIRSQSRAEVDHLINDKPLRVTVEVNSAKVIDEIRSSNFSIVALQQLYNEDHGQGEQLFLDLNPLGWFDRRTQEVLSNTKGRMVDKPAFFREYHVKGIYMAGNS